MSGESPVVTFGLAALRVTDLEVSRRFWADGCGLAFRSTINTPRFDAILVGEVGQPGLELVQEHSPNGPVTAGSGFWKIVLNTSSATGSTDRAVAHGGTEVMAPTVLEQFGGIILALVEDPDGYLVEFVESPS